MTKLKDIPAKADRAREAKTSPADDRWNPNKPFHVTREEFWEHIHEIERGPFVPVEETHQRIRAWMDSFHPKS